MTAPKHGEIWWAEAEDKRRPVLVVTRSEAAAVLRWLIVAPITRTIRGIPTEIPLDSENGLREASVASMDNVQPIRRSYLTNRIGVLGPEQLTALCHSLRAMAGC